ncbi:MAG TPA: EAL domain-containing protein [Nitrospiria bacterium]
MNDRPLKLLVIENKDQNPRLVADVPDEFGVALFDLHCTDRLSKGLLQLRDDDLSVILLDLALPDSQGFETFRSVHSQAPNVPLIVLVPSESEELATKAVEAGAQDFILKEQLNTCSLIRTIFYATERKRVEKRLSQLVYYDGLTNLPNRILFVDRLSQAITRVAWHKRLVAVMFLDLDHFKRINDTLGHKIGDSLLKAVSARLTSCLRVGDTVARMGSDEFTIILADVARSQDVARLAEKIIDLLSKPYLIEDRELFVTASIGISLYPIDGDDAEALLKGAEVAMFRTKEQGRNNFLHYSPVMNVQAFERLVMENSLRHALNRNQLLLHYQPQVDLYSKKITCMEALIRWNHPDLGMVPPASFIPIAEDTGLIIPIGEWVLRTACAQNKAWHGAGNPPIRVGVNLSIRQFHQQDLVRMVARVLEETGLQPQFLELELTESIMEKAEETVKTLCHLKDLGIKISIDDFGTGYSSLSYLKRFPISRLKIDRSFVNDLAKDRDDEAIVRATITLAHNLNLKAIAEGVETEEQLHILGSLGCDEIQGYLFSPTLPLEKATFLLSERKELKIPIQSI